jgi:hypothetical protein
MILAKEMINLKDKRRHPNNRMQNETNQITYDDEQFNT